MAHGRTQVENIELKCKKVINLINNRLWMVYGAAAKMHLNKIE